MRNNVASSMIKNAIIEDLLPEGVEYVHGTIRIDGNMVTDAEDGDSGHYKDGKITWEVWRYWRYRVAYSSVPCKSENKSSRERNSK